MEIIPIAKEHTYTEWCQYYRYSIEKFKEVFEQRHLDWDYFLGKAEKSSSNSSGQWSFSVSDVLADDLQEYDSSIRMFYNKNKESGMSDEDIYLKFAESKKNIIFFHIKIK